MARIVSFGWTAAALVAGAKTCTRRTWNPRYAATFRAGEPLIAYDKSPRARGRPIADIRLTQDVAQEPNSAARDSDFDAEGFAWFAEHPEMLLAPDAPLGLRELTREGWAEWKRQPGWFHVVRFELVGLRVDPGDFLAALAARAAAGSRIGTASAGPADG